MLFKFWPPVCTCAHHTLNVIKTRIIAVHVQVVTEISGKKNHCHYICVTVVTDIHACLIFPCLQSWKENQSRLSIIVKQNKTKQKNRFNKMNKILLLIVFSWWEAVSDVLSKTIHLKGLLL